MKVLICAIGSRGDVQPMVVLGEALKARGHGVRIAAPPNFRAFVERAGLSFVPCGADTAQLIEDNRRLAEAPPWRAIPGQFALLRRESERQMRELLSDTEPVDVVVAAGLAFGGRSLAARQNAVYTFVCYTLAGIPDDAYPPAAIPIFGLPRWGNRLLWALLVRVFDWAMKKPFERVRAEFGLPAEKASWHVVHASQCLLAQDSLVGSLGKGTALASCEQVAAIVPAASQEGPLPDAVEQFLRAPGVGSSEPTPRVVYIGFGSMPTVDRQRLRRDVVEFQRVTGAKVLLYSTEPRVEQLELPPQILAVGSLDHSRLFPRTDFIVHHGGAGTLAAVLRAGVPQLVVPHIVDQFFHGRRVAELGLGPAPIAKAKLSAAGLIQAFHSALGCQLRAKEAGQLLAGTSGAEAAADYLERLHSAR